MGGRETPIAKIFRKEVERAVYYNSLSVVDIYNQRLCEIHFISSFVINFESTSSKLEMTPRSLYPKKDILICKPIIQVAREIEE